MKGDRFDSVARSFASPTRRGALLLAGIALCGLGGALGWSDAQTRPGERQRDRRRQRRRERERRRQRLKPGRPLYPDLQTLAPEDLRFDEVAGVHVLRFTNTVWNAGEGPLELEMSRPRKGKKRRRASRLYQNLYDAPVDGKRAARRRVNGRIIFHDGHNHFHFADFATYELLQCDNQGDCEPIGESVKTSFCLVDSELMVGSHPRQYTVCELTEPQGITPGYGDKYDADLPDQWVVLPDWPLADGEYAVRSIADTLGLLAEGGAGREENNEANVYFTVDSGQISNVREAP